MTEEKAAHRALDVLDLAFWICATPIMLTCENPSKAVRVVGVLLAAPQFILLSVPVFIPLSLVAMTIVIWEMI
jgi:hypothetical protein